MISIQTEQSVEKKKLINDWDSFFFEMRTFPFKAICTHWHTTTDLLSQSAPTSFVYRIQWGFWKVFLKVIFQSFSFERLSVNLYVMVFVGLTSIVLLKLSVYFFVESIRLVSLFVYLDEVTKVVTTVIFVVPLSVRFSYVITKSVFSCRYL